MWNVKPPWEQIGKATNVVLRISFKFHIQPMYNRNNQDTDFFVSHPS
jgi:hypothetical protein